ncbi:MAG: sulfurtransferase [Candidatus Korobacteraceae bacterium]
MTNVTVAIALMGAAVLGPVLKCTAQADQVQVRSEMLVSTTWLEQHPSDRDLVILYVGRSRSEYDAGHIPGARFLPFDELVEQHKDSLNDLPSVATLQSLFESLGVGDGSRVVLYGDGGGLLAARAYFTLDYLGHADRVALLDGGMEKWTSEARPMDRQTIHPVPRHFTPRVQSDVLIATPQMREITDAIAGGAGKDYVLLDARSPREFDGTVLSDAVPKAGHLPGARSLYWKTLLRSGGVPLLLDATGLQEAFTGAGAGPDKLVVTYCRTGIQSSFTYFVAKYLGYRVAMYDGSVYEWVNREGYDLVGSTRVVDKTSVKK